MYNLCFLLHIGCVLSILATITVEVSSKRISVPSNNKNIRLHGCLDDSVLHLPFCNTSLSFEERAVDLRQRMTFDEKMCFMVSKPRCNSSRLDLPAYNWAVEDDHGAGIACLIDDDGVPHCPTIFPTLSIVAASFNETLWQDVGKVIGTEMRASNNVGGTRARDAPIVNNPPIGVNGWGPNLNIARDPRWGRNSEVPSEDSFLSGKLGAAMSRGIQGDPSEPYVLLLGALKHVTAYSLESWVDDTGGPHNGTKYSRFGFSGTISRHDLAETYLEQYRIAITEGNTLGMMCSYSAINGTASCENPRLLTTWARGSAGFKGNVVTDCGALAMSSEPSNETLSAADALNAGTDLNCGNVFPHGLGNAIQQGLTTEARLNASLDLSFTLLMKAGYFDPLEQQPYAAIPPSAVGTDASHELAKESALQGMILLANNKNTLPLQGGKTTAVIGPLANATLALGSRYYDAICPGPLNPKLPWQKGERSYECIKSPVKQMMKRGKVIYASGWDCPDDRPGDHCVATTSTSNFSSAINAAGKADQIVMFMGLDHTIETEGHDRQTLSLPGAQPALIDAVRKAYPTKPLTIVLMNGGAVSLDCMNDPAAPCADAVVETFFAGIEGGEAIACALYGEEGCNRWGKLPVTVFPSSFQKNDMANMGVSTGGSGMRTYKYYTNEFGTPLYSFGHGLSYTTFTTTLDSSSHTVSLDVSAHITVTITNTGAKEGDEVALMYLTPSNSDLKLTSATMPLPNRKLVGFARVTLKPQESTKVTFTVSAEQLALVDENGDTILFEGNHTITIPSYTGKDVVQHFIVDSTQTIRTLSW